MTGWGQGLWGIEDSVWAVMGARCLLDLQHRCQAGTCRGLSKGDGVKARGLGVCRGRREGFHPTPEHPGPQREPVGSMLTEVTLPVFTL